MPEAMKSGVTLVSLLLFTLAGAIWGWHALTRPLPGSAEPPLCRDRAVTEGSRLHPDQVTVSVYNASERAGLAGSTLDALGEAGFGAGEHGNAPRGTQVLRAQIWVDDVDGPAAALVRSYLGKGTPVREGPALGPGVVVVLGAEFEGIARGRPFVVVRADATVCSPTG